VFVDGGVAGAGAGLCRMGTSRKPPGNLPGPSGTVCVCLGLIREKHEFRSYNTFGVKTGTFGMNSRQISIKIFVHTKHMLIIPK
jgi:hypothetical protein